jgi:hypothetical protein
LFDKKVVSGAVMTRKQQSIAAAFLENAPSVQTHSPNQSQFEASLLQQELRLLTDLFDEAQARRIALGERLRAALQGRESKWGGVADLPECDVDECLKMMRDGVLKKPLPVLADAYASASAEECDYRAKVELVIPTHPAWYWLQDVKGAGALLSGRLLARLDLAKAATPSAFWSYCGLATVPGFAYECSVCGLTVGYPHGYATAGLHQQLRGKGRCAGTLELVGGKQVRVAPRRPQRGQSATYDRNAKKICYLFAVSFLRTRSPYANYYRDERAAYALKRPHWTDQRQHLSALRKTEKQFLAHLWCVWRSALGLSVMNVLRPQDSQLTGLADAWSMAGKS